MIDFAIIGNYRHVDWEDLPHIFHESLHIQNESFLWHYTVAPSLFQTALSITEQHGTKPIHFRSTCSRGRFRSAPGHSEQFLIPDGFGAFDCQSKIDNSNNNFDIICQLYIYASVHTREVKHYNMMICEDVGLFFFLLHGS